MPHQHDDELTLRLLHTIKQLHVYFVNEHFRIDVVRALVTFALGNLANLANHLVNGGGPLAITLLFLVRFGKARLLQRCPQLVHIGLLALALQIENALCWLGRELARLNLCLILVQVKQMHFCLVPLLRDFERSVTHYRFAGETIAAGVVCE